MTAEDAAIVLAAIAWWRSRRPLVMTEAEHLRLVRALKGKP